MRRVLDGVTLIDGTGAPPRRARVVIEGAHVAEVGPASADGDDVADGPRYVIPGLVDAHAHAETPAQWAALVRHGVTTIRNPATAAPHPVRPRPDEVDAPHVIAAGPAIDLAARAADLPSICPVSSADDVRRAVARHVDAGFDWIKLYTGLSPELVRAGIDAAHGAGRPVLGDLVATSWGEAAELAIDGLCHAVPRHAGLLPAGRRADYAARCAAGKGPAYLHWLELLDVGADEVARTADALARRAVPLDVTLVALEAALLHADPHARADAGLEPLPADAQPAPAAIIARLRRAFDSAVAFVGALARRGVPIVAGSDTPRHLVPAGRSLHRELALLCRAGLAPRDAIAAASGSAARALLGDGADRGTVRPGQRADLLILDADPLADITNTARIAAVIVGGRERGADRERGGRRAEA